MALATKEIYIFEIYARVVTIARPRDGLWGRKAISFLDNEAASAAPTNGGS